MTAAVPGPSEAVLTRVVDTVLHRWPTVGVSVGVVRPGAPPWLHQRGVTDVGSGAPVGPATVFRAASVTKVLTALAVMRLWEDGLVDLDAPVERSLSSVALVPGRPGLGPVTLRHLLTHTAGVRAVRGPSDLLRPAMGWGVPAGREVPTPARYYRRGLRYDVEPGTRWAYSNHGFTVLAQAVADVAGVPFDRYLRERVLDPLGMHASDVVPSRRLGRDRATGYRLGARGPEPAPDLAVATAGGGALLTTAPDLCRLAEALLGAGTNAHGTGLQPATVRLLLAPHHQPDPRLPGMGLGVFRGEVGPHRTVGHDGIWWGFRSDVVLAPDAGLGVVVLTSTGAFDPRGAAVPLADALLRALLGVGEPRVPDDVPDRPWTWGDLCGRYAFGPGLWTDPQPRASLGAGLEVVVRAGRLVVRGRSPVPAVRRGLVLHPTRDDPDVFCVDAAALGAGVTRVAFARGADGAVTALHLELVPMTFLRVPGRAVGGRATAHPARFASTSA